MNDDQLIAAARDYEDDPDVPFRLSEIALELARRLEAALAREEEITRISIAQQNAGAALVRAYQARVQQLKNTLADAEEAREEATDLLRWVKSDRPTAHSDRLWEALDRFLYRKERHRDAPTD